MINVHDDNLSEIDTTALENFMTGDSFPWFFSQAGFYNTSTFVSESTKHLVENNKSIKEYFVLSHVTYDYERGVVSTFNDPCVKILNSVVKDNYKLLRIKCNLSPRVESFRDTEYNIPHTDFKNLKSKTMLYYVNDSDGDTFFFNNKGNIIERVSPKKGRAVLFDSNQLHAGSHPAKSEKRICINFNFQYL
jgi:hypothetical protein